MTVRVERRGAVTTVVLDRPAVRNAVDRETAEALSAAFREFEADPAARVAVLWGAHGTFCAGADLKAIAAGLPNRVEPDGDAPLGVGRLRLSKPVIAAIAGHALAGGLELALWCDLRVIEEDAVLRFANRRWGVPLLDGGTVRLPRLIGLGRALDLVLTGRSIGAAEAERIGLANRVVATGTARAAAERLAQELAELPQESLRADRMSLYQQAGRTLEDGLRAELRSGSKALSEALAGARRFAQGSRAPGSDQSKPA